MTGVQTCALPISVLYDETAEIKLKIWGDIASEINDGDALELFSARIQNGILYNTSNGWEKVHKIGEYDK